MKYENYQVKDFLKDEFFVKWVKNPSAETNHFWDTWIQEHPEKLDEIGVARSVIISIGPSNTDYPTIKSYNHVLESIYKAEGNSDVLEKKSTQRLYLNYAAVIVFFIAVGGAFWGWLGVSGNQEFSSVDGNQTMLVVNDVPKGQKSTYILEDGSRIKVNSESVLKFSEHFDHDRREVYLQGEAFFEVVKDNHRPFYVISGDVTTRVLGTSFNIKAYPEDNMVSISLVTGKLEINSDLLDTGEIVLTPNQKAEYNKTEKSITKVAFDPKQIDWRDDIISFKRTSFDEMVKVLERWYNVTFVYDEKPKMEAFTGEFQGQSLESVLQGISFSADFSFRLEGKIVYLDPRD